LYKEERGEEGGGEAKAQLPTEPGHQGGVRHHPPGQGSKQVGISDNWGRKLSTSSRGLPQPNRVSSTTETEPNGEYQRVLEEIALTPNPIKKVKLGPTI